VHLNKNSSLIVNESFKLQEKYTFFDEKFIQMNLPQDLETKDLGNYQKEENNFLSQLYKKEEGIYLNLKF
jgi:hypothetical protein